MTSIQTDPSSVLGQFHLEKNSEDFLPLKDANPRAGATEAPREQEDLDLPQVVWLRGDEPWFDSFDLDADEVMKRLGIKRSRLTQLSGRELRVGRVRVDRYIRPLYRSTDVEQYIQWTRATASHQKSSSALLDAVEALNSQGEQISHALEQATQNLSRTLHADLISAIEPTVKDSFAGVDQNLKDLQQVIIQFQNSLHKTTALKDQALQTHVTSLDIRLEALEQLVTAINLRISQVFDRSLKLVEAQEKILELLRIQQQESQGQTLALTNLWDQLQSHFSQTGMRPKRSLLAASERVRQKARRRNPSDKVLLATPQQPRRLSQQALARRQKSSSR